MVTSGIFQHMTAYGKKCNKYKSVTWIHLDKCKKYKSVTRIHFEQLQQIQFCDMNPFETSARNMSLWHESI
jgi:hypothetical protein